MSQINRHPESLHASWFSRHIVEVAEFLKPFPSVCFRFFEIDMTTGEPRYTYRLREGVSDERIGMYILKKAGVVDLIESLWTSEYRKKSWIILYLFVIIRIISIFVFVKCFFGAGCNSLPAVIVRDSLSRDWFSEILKPTVKVRMIEEIFSCNWCYINTI